MLVNTAYRYANVIPVCHSGTVFISSFLNVKSSGFLQQACGTQSSECEYNLFSMRNMQHNTAYENQSSKLEYYHSYSIEIIPVALSLSL